MTRRHASCPAVGCRNDTVQGMEIKHELPGNLMVRAVDIDGALERAVAKAFGGGSAEPAPPSGVVTIRSAARPGGAGPVSRPPPLTLSGDAGDGRTVGRTPDGWLVEDRHGWVELRGSTEALEVLVGPRMPGWAVVRDIVRPAVQVAGIAAGTTVVHAAAVDIDGTAVLICGWSESGKTEVALALVERGATFIGDKWTVLAAGRPVGESGDPTAATIAPFPGSVGIRDWVLPWLPRLRAGLGGGRGARLTAGRMADSISRRVTRTAARNRISDALIGPIGEVASLASTIRISPDEIRRIHGQEPDPRIRPLGALIVLSTIEAGHGVTVAPLEPRQTAHRLAVSAAYERRAYHLLGERAAFHGEPPIPGFGIVSVEAEVLAGAIGPVPVLEVNAPFPTDPGIAAEAIRVALRG